MKEKITVTRETSLATVFENEEASRVFEQVFPGMKEQMLKSPMPREFTLKQMAGFGPAVFTEDKVAVCEELWGKIDVYVETGYARDYPLTREAAEIIKGEDKTYFEPGTIMRDTEGKRIQAHGGAVLWDDGYYYWYGENKDRTDGKGKVWTWGIRAYRSRDLYHWEDMGLIIEPDLENPKSGLYPENHADRPHIIKCAASGKYVCWIKQCGDEACFMVLQSDNLLGPYDMVHERYRPYGIEVGDFDLVVDEETKKAYLYMDGNHATVFGFCLTEDYLQVEKEVSRQYVDMFPPLCREGVTVFSRGKKKYMITSGMSGYVPNKSDMAVSDDWEHPFESIGNPHIKDESNTSFNSQISQIFRVEGKKDLYIALADRWVPDFPVDARLSEMIVRFIGNHHDPIHYPITEQEQKELMNSPMLKGANTSAADYIWLPLTFEDDRPQIRWYDQWRIADFR